MVVDDEHAGHGWLPFSAACARTAAGTDSSTSVPSPGEERTTATPPWRRIRPTTESARPRRSARDGGGVEAPAPVADEQRDPVGLDLQVHVDLVDTGVDGGVAGRLAPGGHQGPAGVVERRVAHQHGVDAHPVPVLHVGELPPEQVGQPERPGGGALAVQPLPQLPLLAAGQAADLPAVGGPLLDQGQRLEHAVVEVGGDIGPLLGQDPRPAARRPGCGRAGPGGAEHEGQTERGRRRRPPRSGPMVRRSDMAASVASPPARTRLRPSATRRAAAGRAPLPAPHDDGADAGDEGGKTTTSRGARSDSSASSRMSPRMTAPVATALGQPDPDPLRRPPTGGACVSSTAGRKAQAAR